MNQRTALPAWKTGTDHILYGLALGVLAFFSLVPVSYLAWPKWTILGKTMPAHYPILLCLAVLFTLYSFWKTATTRNWPVFYTLSCLVMGSFLLSSVMAPGWMGPSLKASLGVWSKGAALGWIFYYMVRFKSCEKKWILAVSLIGLLAAGGALYEVWMGKFFIFERLPMPIRLSDFYAPVRGIAVGAVGQPLPFSFFLIGLLPLALDEALQRRSVLFGLASFLIATAIFFTYRRTGIFLTLLIALFLFLQTKNGTRRTMIAGIAVLFAFLAAVSYFKNPNSYKRFLPSAIMLEIEESPRTWGVKKSLEVFSSAPLFGVGPRGYEKTVDHQDTHDLIYETPDNQLLLFLAEGGLIGISIFLFFLLYLLKLIGFHLKNTPSRGLGLSLISMVVAFAFFDALYWSAPLALFWSVSGVAAGMYDRELSFRMEKT